MSKKQVLTKENLSSVQIGSLKIRISDEQLRLKKLLFAHTMTPLENPMVIRGLRKSIARLQTELSVRK